MLVAIGNKFTRWPVLLALVNQAFAAQLLAHPTDANSVFEATKEKPLLVRGAARLSQRESMSTEEHRTFACADQQPR